MSEAPITAADIQTWARVERALQGKSAELRPEILELAEKASTKPAANRKEN